MKVTKYVTKANHNLMIKPKDYINFQPIVYSIWLLSEELRINLSQFKYKDCQLFKLQRIEVMVIF
jgi:hypothetical protein